MSHTLCRIGFRGCVRDHGPVCDPCWSSTTAEQQQQAKEEHNEAYLQKPLGTRRDDMFFCSKPGCWQVVRVAEIGGRVCHHYKVHNRCADTGRDERAPDDAADVGTGA